MKINENDRNDLEAVKLQFIEEWTSGNAPTLQEYARRYPQFAGDLAEFVVSFAALENAVARTATPASPSPSTLTTIKNAVAGSSTNNLAEARKAMGWGLDRLAQELNLPTLVALQLERGGIRDWPAKLEEKLAEVLGRTRTQVAALLSAPVSFAAPAHYSAKGKPQTTPAKVRTFREAMEYCQGQGELTDEQRREWIEDTA